MSKSKIIPIQFQKKMVKSIDEYIDSGLYASKAEFVREAVRMRLIELRKSLFSKKVQSLKELSKSRGARVKSFLSKKEKNSIAKNL